MTLQQASRLRVAEDITELVGETPLLHLRKLPPPGVAADSAERYLSKNIFEEP
jgi:hypothetical protein